MAGWIKLHRSIDEWAWRKSPDTLSVWLYLLTNARHEAGSWKGIDLDAGQLVIGRKALSEKTGVSERASRTAIERLKSANAITTKTTNKYTLVTIVNWAFYQQDGEKTTSKTTSKTTNKRPANDQQTTTNKNVKNENNRSSPQTPKGGLTTTTIEALVNRSVKRGIIESVDAPMIRVYISRYLSSGLTAKELEFAIDVTGCIGGGITSLTRIARAVCENNTSSLNEWELEVWKEVEEQRRQH